MSYRASTVLVMVTSLASACIFPLPPLRDAGFDAGAADSGALACAPGYGDCDLDAGNGCETKLDVDPLHCAQCGHDCLGGVCSGGECSPVSLVPAGSVAGAGIAVDDGYLYFGLGDRVVRRDKHSGASLDLVSGGISPLSLTSNTQAVFWSDTIGRSVGEARKNQVGALPVASAQTVSWGYLAADEAYVYWCVPDAGLVRRASVDGGPSVSFVAAVSPHSIAVGKTGLAFTSSDGNVFEVQFDGGGLHPVATGLGDPTHLVFGVDALYVGDGAGGRVWRVTDQGQLEVASGQTDVHGLAADSSGVYWAYTSGIEWLRPDGGHELFFSQPGGVHRIATDGRAVYWTDWNGRLGARAEAVPGQ